MKTFSNFLLVLFAMLVFGIILAGCGNEAQTATSFPTNEPSVNTPVIETDRPQAPAICVVNALVVCSYENGMWTLPEIYNGNGSKIKIQPTQTMTVTVSTMPNQQLKLHDYTTLEDAKQLVVNNDTYHTIDNLNSFPNKKEFAKGSRLVGPLVLWTGWYNESAPLPDGLTPVILDGRTGIYFLQEGKTVTTVNAGAMLLHNSTCINPSMVIEIINAFKGTDELYDNLDQMRYEWPSASFDLREGTSFTFGNVTTLTWGQIGFLPSSFLSLDEHIGKGLYVATSEGDATPTHAGAGIQICSPGINPEQNFPWWNK